MGATTVTGKGPGEAPLQLRGYDIDNLRRVTFLSNPTKPVYKYEGDKAFFDDLSAAGANCPKYVVNCCNPHCPYQTIQAGYDAAVADGHNEENPAMVHVHTGNYNEDVVMTVPGIHIVGDPGHDPDQ